MNEPDREGMIEGKDFTCPKCGSHAFGTHTIEGVDATAGTSASGKYLGVCHGYAEVKRLTGRHQTNPVERCTFTWPREDDDKYFKGNGHFSPAIVTATVVSP